LATSGAAVRWIMDVGAHIGSFTHCAKGLWPEARVIAVEPAPDSTPYFLLNTAGLAGIALERVALVDRGSPRIVDLVDVCDDNLGGRFVPRVFDASTPRGRQVIRVPAINVLALLKKYSHPPIDVLKLDCEGAEGVILDDLAQSGYLRKVRFVCGEWHGLPTTARIRAAVSETHHLELHPGNQTLGLFFAYPKGEPSPWRCPC
jgi:FkbM family methyltransferase